MIAKFKITENIVTGFRNWFVKYINSFPVSDADMQHGFTLKKQHSLRVCKEIIHIGSGIGLDREELLLAESCALFHDIGRFEQYSRYKTFVDGKSENHADLAIKVLRENRILDVLDKTPRDIVIKAILYHNRLSIPEGEDGVITLFSRLLRDADKLDIFNLLTDYYRNGNSGRISAIELGLPDSREISGEVIECLMEGRLVESTLMKSLNDFKLLKLGWVFDINFTPSLEVIRDRKYLQIIREALPSSADVDKVYSRVSMVLESRIASSS
jgi:hypothetical protein